MAAHRPTDPSGDSCLSAIRNSGGSVDPGGMARLRHGMGDRRDGANDLSLCLPANNRELLRWQSSTA